MQAVISTFMGHHSYAWMAATHASRFLSLSVQHERRHPAMVIAEEVSLSIHHHPEPPFLRLVIDQLDETIDRAQRYVDTIHWWLRKLTSCLDTLPVYIVAEHFHGTLIRCPGVVKKIDTCGEFDYTFQAGKFRDILVNLEEIDLSYSLSLSRHIGDIELFRDCQKLRKVYFCGSDIVDLAWVNTEVVEHLDVRWCMELKDLSALQSAPALHALRLNMNPVEDLAPLSGCTRLEHLDLIECEEIKDFCLIATLRAHLVHLNLSSTSLGAMDFLSDFCRLESLDVSRCGGVDDLSPLSNVRTLRKLCIDYTGVSSLEPLQQCLALEELSACRCRAISDATPLSQLTALRTVVLAETGVQDVSCLRACPHLSVLSVRDCALTAPATAAAFAEWPALTRLSVARSPLKWEDAQAEALSRLPFVDIRDYYRPRPGE